MSEDTEAEIAIETLPLDGWHREQGARMVPFAGYEMPIQYEGIVAEHTWTRAHAGLFDVSHMGQLVVSGPEVAAELEKLLPGDIAALKPGRIRYSLLLDDNGGILDDLMVTNITPAREDGTSGEPTYYLVVNGATKWDDIAHLRERLPDAITLTHLDEQALIAVQGPEAAQAVRRVLGDAIDSLTFMQGTSIEWNGVAVGVGRSGYTGEDGFELSVPADHAEALARRLFEEPEIKPVGLGARDSLRLEAGLPLYGHDLSPETDPVSADLGFALSKRRREEGGFPGAERILHLRAEGAPTKRVGLRLDGKLPAREGAKVFAGQIEVGTVTSGGFSPTLGHPIAMAYIAREHAEPGAALEIEVRGKRLNALVAPMPFVPHRYYRGS